MDPDKERMLLLAVLELVSMIEFVVVMAVQYMQTVGDDSIFDQIKKGCIAVMGELDAVEASVIFYNKLKRKRNDMFPARKRLPHPQLSAILQVSSQDSYERMFKMDAGTFAWICEQMGPFLENTDRKQSIPVVKRISVALFRLATGANSRTAGDRFGVRELEATEFTAEFCQILCDHFRHLVAYPEGDHLMDITAGFEAATGLPNCVGAIGCLQVSVLEPPGPAFRHTVGEKSVLRIVTQMAIDSNCRILSLATGFSSALSNLRNFGLSTLYANLHASGLSEMPPVSIEGVNIIPYFVGDQNYELKSWLMVPFSGEGLLDCEDKFDKALGRGLALVDKTVDALVGWGILSEVMLVDVTTAVHMVGAICIMHNLLLDRASSSEEDVPCQSDGPKPDLVLPLPEDPQRGQVVRDALATYLGIT